MRPSFARLVAAFVAAPLAASLLMAALEPGYAGFSGLAPRIIYTTFSIAVFGAYPAEIVNALCVLTSSSSTSNGTH
jgi:hypothetical protein